ncbi:MAG: hypothetical protein GX892_09295 [Thermoanaerobacteraceae bacterium]|nr:hypothetical protein [Thermoanaerobacteraceae bacterium]
MDKIILQHQEIVKAIMESKPIDGERLVEEHLHEGDAGLQRLKDSCFSYFKLESV